MSKLQVPKDCEFCGKNFITKRADQKYCSEICSKERWGRNKLHIEKTCVICGKNFLRTHQRGSVKTCSKECSEKNRINTSERSWKNKRYKRACAYCQAPFETCHKHVSFCSIKCSSDSGLIVRSKSSYKTERICLVCKKNFIISSGSSNTCSKECRRDWRNETARVWIAKNKVKVVKPIQERKKPSYSFKVCILCSNSFFPKNGGQKVCEGKCFEELKKEREKRKSESRRERKREKSTLLTKSRKADSLQID